MQFIIGLLLGFVASLLANYFSPPFRKWMDAQFSSLCHLLDPDKFDLTGKWKQVFREPSPYPTHEPQTTEETVTLKHIGNHLSGTGEVPQDHRSFKYHCQISHSMVFGEYEKVGERGNLTGKGLIQLIVAPDRLSMKGQATWFDRDTERIESSESTWTKES